MAGRNLERLLVFSILVAVIVVIDIRIQALQAQVESASVRNTLGALRTALVLDDMEHRVRPSPSPPENNPFLLLRELPANYAGQRSALEISAYRPGAWVYEPLCGCIGYAPVHARWSISAEPSAVLWFRISKTPGESRIDAIQSYPMFDENQH